MHPLSRRLRSDEGGDVRGDSKNVRLPRRLRNRSLRLHLRSRVNKHHRRDVLPALYPRSLVPTQGTTRQTSSSPPPLRSRVSRTFLPISDTPTHFLVSSSSSAPTSPPAPWRTTVCSSSAGSTCRRPPVPPRSAASPTWSRTRSRTNGSVTRRRPPTGATCSYKRASRPCWGGNTLDFFHRYDCVEKLRG